jgi:hypothetical protein
MSKELIRISSTRSSKSPTPEEKSEEGVAVVHRTRVQRFDRFQSLAAGQYWRAVEPVEAFNILVDEVLLISSLKYVENNVHTVELRPHPNDIAAGVKGMFRLLLSDFLKAFVFEPDAAAIRARELRAVQEGIEGVQEELRQMQSNPELMRSLVEERLRESHLAAAALLGTSEESDVTAATPLTAILQNEAPIETIEALRRSAGLHAEIAGIQSQLLQERITNLSALIKGTAPYYEEQGAAALAQTEDAREYADKLLQGIETLDLYVGKNVTVRTIRTGVDAPVSEQLVICQRKLYVGEELAVFRTVSEEEFDYKHKGEFFDALISDDDFVNQVFPAARCVVCMAYRRHNKNYEDIWESYHKNQYNTEVFLLVRNGENIHQVFSEDSAHLKAARLFPSREEVEKIFEQSSFWEPKQITLDDVAFADHFHAFEKNALHYRRFLILLAGLDHRLKLFGEFAPQKDRDMFVSEYFQKKYLRFLHDDDGLGMLPAPRRIPFDEWVRSHNRNVTAGSRVLCNWYEVLNRETAPGVVKENSRGSGYYRSANPVNSYEIVIAYRKAGNIFVDCRVEREVFFRDEPLRFDAKVAIEKYRFRSTGWLCLDRVDWREMIAYVQDRKTREEFGNYLEFFKIAIRQLRQEEDAERETREALKVAIIEGNVANSDDCERIVQEAVWVWRAANRGSHLPRLGTIEFEAEKESMWSILFRVARTQSVPVEAIRWGIEERGDRCLRVAVTGKGRIVSYSAPGNREEPDRGLTPNHWVKRETVTISKKGKIKIDDPRWCILRASFAAETVLFEDEKAIEWISSEEPGINPSQMVKLFAHCDEFESRIQKVFFSLSEVEFDELFEQSQIARRIANTGARFVQEPTYQFPFGVMYRKRTGRTLMVSIAIEAFELLLRVAPDETRRKAVLDWYLRPYSNEAWAVQRLEKSQGKNCFRPAWFELQTPKCYPFSQKGLGILEISFYAEGRTANEQFNYWHSRLRSHGNEETVWLNPNVFSEGKFRATELITLINARLAKKVTRGGHSGEG